MKTLQAYIQNLLSYGKHFFSQKNALAALNISENQFYYQFYRLSQKKVIRRIAPNFYMIIPAEYRALGSLPPSWIVDSLMNYLGRKYYIGLLSAASLYGTTEQQPMTFQVIVDKATRKIKLPRGGIDFHTKYDCAQSETDRISFPTGYATISTKEQTMVDLVHYYKASGGLSNVALIIKDLGSECSAKALEQVINKKEETATLQRLGYLLELTDHPTLADVIERNLSKRNHFYILFRPDFHEKTGERLSRWKLILNDSVELS